ncbi:FMN-binding protein [Allomuricauda taeanensis]|uniref:FMN-binding protein n=1 Tax=Flagellimonas taeanensis TaxID=1005926 RepID=UPI002E7B6706|nr:FMN-binding protein [Allomuricauda taeanensis]MEE1962751.1 FMN-binding protein [Allomuricauda taeanensis]
MKMNTRYLLLLMLIAFWNCKQKVEKATPEPVFETVKKPEAPSPELGTIAQFMGIASDSTVMATQLRSWIIDENGVIDSVDIHKGILLYKKLLITGKGELHPIFGAKDRNETLVVMSNQGYGGNIRGVFLIDKSTLEIKKVAFEHMAESEGYGAAIALPTFEDQFQGTKINWDENTFGLNQNDKTIIKGDKVVDGISGATITSRLTVEMINNGLKKYKPFFIQ